MKEKDNLWQEVKADLDEGTACGYKMALLDSDKLLRVVLKQKGYPGKDLKKQLFWAGISTKNRPNFKNALEKKDEILNSLDYQLSSFEIEDFLEAYRKVIGKVMESEKMGLKRKIGIYFENYFSLKGSWTRNSLITFFAFLFGIKFLSGTGMGQSITDGIVVIDDTLFSWFIILLLLGLGVALIVLISFTLFDKKKKVRIKE